MSAFSQIFAPPSAWLVEQFPDWDTLGRCCPGSDRAPLLTYVVGDDKLLCPRCMQARFLAMRGTPEEWTCDHCGQTKPGDCMPVAVPLPGGDSFAEQVMDLMLALGLVREWTPPPGPVLVTLGLCADCQGVERR